MKFEMSLHAIHFEDLGQWYSMHIMGKYGPFQSTTCIGIAKSRVSESGQLGVSENVVYPIVPNGFADHYPVFKWLFHWEYTQHFQTNPARSF